MDRVAYPPNRKPNQLKPNRFLLPARTPRILVLVSPLSIPFINLSRFNQSDCNTKRSTMNRNLLFFLLFTAIAIILLAIALYVPNSLPVHSDFSAIYNTDLALVHGIPIYDLEKVE